jgi:hypothetical protein
MNPLRSVVALTIGLAACSAPSGAGQSSHAPTSVVATVPATPAPAALDEAARRFGFVARGDGWTWEALDAKATRFDWSGRPASRDREVLLSFWMPTLDAAVQKFLPALVESAAANLTENNRPCDAFDQSADIVRVLRVERVITVCFEPSQVYGKGFKTGVLHGIVNQGTLTIVAILSDTRAGLIPLASEIGITRTSP